MSPKQTTRPQTATEILKLAGNTLGERGKQYDPAGKQERSMTAIVAAFNAIYPRNLLTVHMGWQFMSLVKMVRGATKPHADSALDQVAYAALAAEEVAEALHQPAALCEDEGCPHHGTPHVCVTSEVSYTSLQVSNQALAEELGKCQHWAGVQSQELKHLEAKAMAAHEAYMQALEHNRSLEVQLDTTHSALADFVCRFDLTKEYMTKEQVLAGQAKHEAQVEKLRERECLDIETINDLRTELASCIAANESMTAKFQAERKANVAMHEEVTRLRGKVQELADLAEYRDKRNSELCAELESLRGSHTALANASQEFKDELAASTRAMLNAQDELESHKLQLDRLRTELHGAEIINVGIRNSLQISEQAAETQRGKCIAQSSRISELQTLVDNLRSSLAQATKEAPCAHNTDEPKAAPRPAYVDPFDQYGDIRSPMHRLVGSLDPARGGLAYPQGKDAPTPL